MIGISDSRHNELKATLPAESYMYREFYMFGHAPTFLLPDNSSRYWWQSKWMTWDEVKADIKANWRPVAADEVRWFLDNLDESNGG